jgi:hypothetical protein
MIYKYSLLYALFRKINLTALGSFSQPQLLQYTDRIADAWITGIHDQYGLPYLVGSPARFEPFNDSLMCFAPTHACWVQNRITS